MALKALPTTEEQASERIVSVLEDALNQAREGKFRTLLIVATSADATWDAMAGDIETFELLGRLELMKRKLVDRLISGD